MTKYTNQKRRISSVKMVVHSARHVSTPSASCSATIMAATLAITSDLNTIAIRCRRRYNNIDIDIGIAEKNREKSRINRRECSE